MAIAFGAFTTVVRGGGKNGVRTNCVAGNMLKRAAYRAGIELTDPLTGERYDYRAKTVLHTSLILPHGANSRFQDPQYLWSAVEAAEHRKDSQLGREWLIALPNELSDDERIALTEEIGRAMCRPGDPAPRPPGYKELNLERARRGIDPRPAPFLCA